MRYSFVCSKKIGLMHVNILSFAPLSPSSPSLSLPPISLSSYPTPNFSLSFSYPPPPPNFSLSFSYPPPPPNFSLSFSYPPPPPNFSLSFSYPPPPPNFSLSFSYPPPPPNFSFSFSPPTFFFSSLPHPSGPTSVTLQ